MSHSSLRRLSLACLLIAGVASGMLGWRWKRQRAVDRRIDEALAAVREGEPWTLVEDAVRLLESQESQRPERSVLEAALQLRQGNAADAIESLQAIRPHGTMRLPFQLLMGEALYQRGRLAEAQGVFRVVEQEHPDEPQALRWLATIDHDLGSVNQSLARLERLAQVRPDHFLAHRLMGLTYAEDFRQFDKAAEHYRLALRRDPPEPDRSDVLRELAQCLVLLGEYAPALEAAQQLAEGPLQLALLVEAHRGLGETDLAQQALERLVELAPDLQGTLLLQGMLAIDRGEPRAAVAPLQSLLARDPHDHVARHQLSRAHQALGEITAAKAESEKMLASKALHQERDALYTRAIGAPGDAAVRRELARVCDELGRTDEARRWRLAAAQLDGTRPR